MKAKIKEHNANVGKMSKSNLKKYKITSKLLSKYTKYIKYLK